MQVASIKPGEVPCDDCGYCHIPQRMASYGIIESATYKQIRWKLRQKFCKKFKNN